jgi:glyoxylase-like metal-dependent hydrolase (beta-lactamase superfamily II)
LFVGDTLFAGSIGRTDLPGGITDTLMMHSIKTQLMSLDDTINVYCGHMGQTTIGRERQFNPFKSIGIKRQPCWQISYIIFSLTRFLNLCSFVAVWLFDHLFHGQFCPAYNYQAVSS